MAISGSYGYTNTTASSVDVTPVAVGISNYAISVDDPGKCVLKNITSPIDQAETLMFMAQDVKAINQDEANVHPAKVTGGRKITVKLEAKKRLTSSTDDTWTVDLPLNTTVSWSFPKDTNLSYTDLLTQIKRIIGALQDSSTDGYIIDELMMGQLNPKA